jgi:hypothetical protein
VKAPPNIVCVDCGGTCHLISYERPDEPWEPGDVVAYRCADCNDRWDVVLADEDADDSY